ncbi:MAG: amino acid permease, partial [Halanaerobiales bacterium]
HEKFGTPFRAILTTGITMIVLLLLFNVEQLAKMGSVFNILIFILLNVSVIILRYNKKEWYDPEFRDPFYPFTQIFGIFASLSLLPQLGIVPLFFCVVVVAGGVLWFKLYGKEQALPQYNLFDMLEKEEVPASISGVHKRILVSLAKPEHEFDLLKLASYLGDSIIGFHVIKVPPQTGLEEARADYKVHQNRYKIDHLIEEKFKDNMGQVKGEKRYTEVFSHNVPKAVINEAEKQKIDLILMGWKEGNRFHHVAGSVTEQVLKSGKSHVAVLKGHMPSEINNITVPFGGGDNSRYAFYLAKRLASEVNADVKLLRVVNPEISDNDLKMVREGLEEELEFDKSLCNIDYEIIKRYSRKDAIIAESRECDILIMGDSNERFRLSLLGNIPRKVALNVELPLILVRRYRPLSRERILGMIKC